MPSLSLAKSFESLEKTVPPEVDKDTEAALRGEHTVGSKSETGSSLGDGDGEKAIEHGNADLEKGRSDGCADDSSLIVWWDGEDDPANPMNWGALTKWNHVAIVSAITFVVPLASSMFAPGVNQVMEEFDTSNNLLASLVVSIYVLGLAFGPLVLAPASEVYGRWICYTVCNILYVVFTVACAVSTNLPMLIVFRFLAGCMGSCPLAVGGGTIADLFSVHQRGTALSFYTLGPVCGPAVGPVAGGFLSQARGWRWIFWVLAIASGANTVAQIVFSRETYAVIILQRKTKRLQKQTGNKQLRSKLDRGISSKEVLRRAIVRPTQMTLFSPINIILSVSSAFVYGVLYLLLTTFPMVFGEVYGFSAGISGLTYIGLGVGNVLGLLVFTFTSDRYVSARVAKGEAKPEDRLPLMLVSGPLIAAGLFWYGWSAQAHTHWIVPIMGSALEGIGNMMFFMPIMGYLVDAFTVYAASALAANTVLRSIGGALLPLAGRSMYQALGFGWGNSLLAFLTVAFTPALFLIYRYGETIRLKYPLNL